MNIAITGHMGLIGSLLRERLIQRGHNVVLEIDLRAGNDIIELENLNADVNIDMMIHTAAHCKINESISNPAKTYKNDVAGTFAVFEFCRKNNIPKIVYFSSSRVLSKERNPYTAAKLYGEELCSAYKNSYGIDYIIIRPSTVYGPFNDKTRRLMHIFIMNALRGSNLEIYGDPETKTLDFTYIEDFVDGVMIAIEKGWGRAFNISGKQEFKVKDLAEMIIGETGSQSKIVIKDTEIAQPQKVNSDISAIKELGYNPKVGLIEGVKRNIDYLRELI